MYSTHQVSQSGVINIPSHIVLYPHSIFTQQYHKTTALMEAKPQPATGDEKDSVNRPTHHLKTIHVGDNGVQLLVSTKDHLYNAEDVDAGANSYQVIGAWEDSSVQELAKILNQRQVTANRQIPASAGASRFETTHGTGKSLAGPGSNNTTRVMNRQQVE
jgi:hypothetical protein